MECSLTLEDTRTYVHTGFSACSVIVRDSRFVIHRLWQPPLVINISCSGRVGWRNEHRRCSTSQFEDDLCGGLCPSAFDRRLTWSQLLLTIQLLYFWATAFVRLAIIAFLPRLNKESMYTYLLYTSALPNPYWHSHRKVHDGGMGIGCYSCD